MNCTNDRDIDTGGKRQSIIDKNLYTLFFISKTFIRNARLKLTKNQAKAKLHPEAELLLSGNYLVCSYTLPSKLIGDIPKNVQKQVYLLQQDYIIDYQKMRLKMKNRPYIYDINRPRARPGFEVQFIHLKLNS